MDAPNFVPDPAKEPLLCDAQLLRRKHVLVEQVFAYYDQLAEYYRAHLTLPEPLFGPAKGWQFKAARGDNYHGLPYQVVDGPRRIHVNGNLFLRTCFVWTIGWSVHLIATGRWLPAVEGLLHTAALSSDLQHERWLRASTVGDWAWALQHERLAIGDANELKLSYYFDSLQPDPAAFVRAFGAVV